MLATTQTAGLANYSPDLIAAAEEFGMSPAEYAEMMGEQELTRTMLPLWRFNGQHGVYVDKGKQPYSPDDHSKELLGVILAVSYGQIWLRPFDEPAKYSQPWLCLAGDKRREPRLHPELTEAELAMAKKAGAGVSCMECPLAQWTGDKGEIAPVCSDGVRLFFLTSDNEPILLAFGGNSGRELDKFLSLNFKNRRRPWCSYAVKFGRTHISKEGQSFYKATFALGEAVDKNAMPGLMTLRSQHLTNFERAQAEPVEAMHDVAPDAGGGEDGFPAPAGDAQGELAFDEDGNPLFGAVDEITF